MKKAAKIAAILGAVFLVAGITVSGFNLKKIKSSLTGVLMIESEVVEDDFLAEGIEKIDLRTSNDKVIIKSSDTNKIKVKHYKNEYSEFRLSKDSNILNIEKKSKLMIMNFKIQKPETVEIEIPKELVLDYRVVTSNSGIEITQINGNNAFIKTSNGKITCKDFKFKQNAEFKNSNSKTILENISGEDIKIQNSNGFIDINNMKLLSATIKSSNSKIMAVNTEIEDTTITNGNGEINLDGFKGDQTSLISSNAGIYINNSAIHKLKAQNSNGRILFTDLQSKDISLNNSNSRIEGSIIGNQKDYNKDIKTSNSSVVVNEQKHGTILYDENDAENDIYIRNSNGSINLSFK